MWGEVIVNKHELIEALKASPKSDNTEVTVYVEVYDDEGNLITTILHIDAIMLDTLELQASQA